MRCAPGVQRRSVTAILAAVALLGAPAFVIVTRRVFGSSPPLATQVWLQLAYCVLTFAFIWAAVRLEKLPPSAIGLRRPTIATIALAVALLAAAVVLLPAFTEPIVKWLGAEQRDAGVRELAMLPLWFRLVLAVTGGTIEETLYRGYALGRLQALTGSRWVAGLTVVVIFTLAHIPPWGAVFALAGVLPFSALMTAAYLWRRDLVANSAAHSAALVVGLLGT